MTAILTFARGFHTLAAVRSMGSNGIDVCTCDSVRFAFSFFSRYCRSHFIYPPYSREKEFISYMANKMKSMKRGEKELVLMPMFKDIVVISKNVSRLRKIAKVPVTSYKNIMTVNDKLELYEICKGLDINTPDTYLIRNSKDLERVSKKANFPLVLKLRKSTGAIGMKRVSSPAELKAGYRKILKRYGERPVVQEFIPGRDYCFTSLFNQGDIRAKMCYECIRQFQQHGTGILTKSIRKPKIEKMGTDILKHLKWHGVAEMDFRYSPKTKKHYLTDFNPRFWGGLHQSIVAGVDYASMLYKIATEGDVKPKLNFKANVKSQIFLANILYEIERIGKSKNKADEMRDFLDMQRKCKESIISSDDPMPVIGLVHFLDMLLRGGLENLVESYVSEAR